MSGADDRAMDLSLQGYGCSQILVQLSLETRGRESPDLLQAVSGLHGGLGFSGKLCGAVTGGACVLAAVAGAPPGSPGGARLGPMIQTLVAWFEQEFSAAHGGIDCQQLLGGDLRNQLTRCPQLVLAVHRKVEEILAAEGFGAGEEVR